MKDLLFESTIILALLVGNGVFAMAEIAVVSARKGRLKQMAETGDKRAQAALELAESPNRFLATVQVGITLVGIFAGAFGGATLAGKVASWLQTIPMLAPYAAGLSVALVVAAITYFSLILGELAPKRIGLANPEGIARALAGPMRALSRLASPIVSILSASTEGLLKLAGFKPTAESSVTEEEVKLLVKEGLRAGVFQKSESEMVESVLALDRVPVRELMTPRAKIIWVSLNEAHETVWHKVVVSGHTRFPVYDGGRDRVMGVLSVKALYANLAAGVGVNVKDLMTEPLVVPATQSAVSLLETFKRTGKHMALVTDEFGVIVGLATLHDVLEAIVGEFPSQSQRLKPAAQKRADGSWLIDAILDIDEFEKLVPEFKLDPAEKRGCQTFAGYIVTHLGHVPREGESFQAQGFHVEVIDMDGHRVDKVLMIPLEKWKKQTGEQNSGPAPS